MPTRSTLQGAGAQVTVADARAGAVPAGSLAQQAQEAGVAVLRGYVPLQATGGSQVSAVVVRQTVGTQARGEQRTLPADAVGMSGGWNPAIHLYSHAGGKAQWSQAGVCFQPGTPLPNQCSVGACNADWSLAHTLQQPTAPVAARLRAPGSAQQRAATRPVNPWPSPSLRSGSPETGQPVSRRAKAFVD